MTHNSFAQLDSFTSFNQFRSIPEQLANGIRGFMLDTYYHDGEVRLCHGTCILESIPFKDTLSQINTFLDENAEAVITLVLQNDTTAGELADAFAQVPQLSEKLFTFNGTTWLTLADMVRENDRLVIFVSNLTSEYPAGQGCDDSAQSDCGDPHRAPNGDKQTCPRDLAPNCGHKDDEWLHAQWSLTTETPYYYASKLVMGPDHEDYCAVDRGVEDRNGVSAKSIFILNNFITPPSHVTAADINDYDFLLRSALGCGARRGRLPNFIAVDFENCFLDESAVIQNNCLLPYGDSGVPDVVHVATYLNTLRLSVDTDGDDLRDWEERKYGTALHDDDSDDDGLSDGKEVNVHGSDPLAKDTDSDNLEDGQEIAHGTDPLDSDSDTDGLSDGEEVNVYHTDPLKPDSDSDGLTDGDEIHKHGTLPLVSDTDGDTLSDGDEVNVYGTNPLSKDTDGDELEDGQEVTRGTDPVNGDTDADGLLDGFEVREGFDPRNPDVDGDGLLDGQDPDLVANLVLRLPESAFRASGIRTAILARLRAAEADIARGGRGVVVHQLRSLRRQVDGCGTNADTTDWIVDCEAQQAARLRLDLLIDNLQASRRRSVLTARTCGNACCAPQDGSSTEVYRDALCAIERMSSTCNVNSCRGGSRSVGRALERLERMLTASYLRMSHGAIADAQVRLSVAQDRAQRLEERIATHCSDDVTPCLLQRRIEILGALARIEKTLTTAADTR